MDPISSIATALASIKTATEIARLLIDTDFSLKGAESKLKLAEMMRALADANLEIAQVEGLIAERDQLIRELQDKLVAKGQTQYEAPFYYRLRDGRKEGPYCQKCHDSEDKCIRLQGRGNDCWECLNCNSYFQGPGYVPPRDEDEPYDPLGYGRT